MKTEFKVLSEEERIVLRKVKTTPEQADQILQRCEPLSDFLKGLPRTLRGIRRLAKQQLTGSVYLPVRYRGKVGCPHCQQVESICLRCPWAATVGESPEGRAFCTHVSFGGVTWQDVYWQDILEVDFEPSTEKVTAQLEYVDDATTAKEWRGLLDRAIAYVEGHIEWAHGVKNGDL